MIGIDEASLALWPDEPLVFWSPHDARVLDVLGKVGAKVVGEDKLPALDFVQVAAGEQFAMQDGASMELVYFADGRRERWAGPARMVVRMAGGTAIVGQASVSWLPAAAVAALRRVAPRAIASAEARAGGYTGVSSLLAALAEGQVAAGAQRVQLGGFWGMGHVGLAIGP